MAKTKWLVTLIASLVLAVSGNFLSELVFPLFDPQGNMFSRNLLIGLFAIISILMAALNIWGERRNPSNPADADVLGWRESLEIVSFSMVSILTLCTELSNDDHVQYPLWLITFGVCLLSFINIWPSDRKTQYRQMEAWIFAALEARGVVTIEEILNQFAHTSQSVNERVSPRMTPKGEEYAALIEWFLLNHTREVIREREAILWRRR